MPQGSTRSGSRVMAALAGAVSLALLLGAAGCQKNVQLRQKGREAALAGDHVAALQYYEQAAKRSPDDYRAQYRLGRTYLDLDRPLDAQLALERAYTVRPDDALLTPKILDALAEAMYRQGPSRHASLRAFLDKTSRFYGQPEDYLRQAEYLQKIGDVDGALEAYRKAAYFAPSGDAGPYIKLAEFHESLHDAPAAVQALRQAYWVNPEHPGLAQRLRQHGVVPGPAIAERPPKPAVPTPRRSEP